ncbi:hypothetical protein HPB51_010902 [Rhipicephalus microplus]|uniref:Uncharacterized protein n=1 Tax=Rhipicephalus microplus TaxID=6941 RepID=A0A9J6DMB5_RHIMP|nr:hypothetical protein HPB51_010902 [Rhipicephalus microplus]
MEVVEVEGTEVAPEDATLEAGRISSHRNKQRKHASNAPASLTGQGSASDTPMLNGSAQRLPRKPRQPLLPDDQVKVAIRPRDGLNLSKVGEAQLRDAILREVDLHATLLKEDIYRTFVEANLIVYGQAHQTGDKTCPQRYQTTRLLIYRRQEKAKLQQQQYLSTRISMQDAHPERQEVKLSDTRSRSPSPTSKRRGHINQDGHPAYPARLGNSVARDTTPDLTFTANITHAEWSNLHEHLDSDHYITQTIFKAGPQRRKSKQPAFVDWDVFHELRATASPESVTSIDQWTASLLRGVKRATKTPLEDAVGDMVDTKLLHMWEALAGLRKHYNSNKLNRSNIKQTHCYINASN